MLLAQYLKRISSLALAAGLALGARAAVPSEDALLKIATDANANVVERTRALMDLRAIATDRSISALAPLLVDPAWAHAARVTIEAMPGAAADRALLAALESARDDKLRAGLVDSLGNRGTVGAVPVVAKFLTSPDASLVDSALNALGNIGNVAAGEALVAYQPPAAQKPAWSDAVLRVAEALQSSDKRKSHELYRVVLEKGAPVQSAAALIGVARHADEPAKIVVLALDSPDASSHAPALAVIRAGEFGLPLTAALAGKFSAYPPALQVQILSVLHDRADRTAAPIARRALTATDAAVRAAAAKLLSVIGEPSDAPALLRLMVGPDEPAPSTRLALMRIPGPETTSLLLESFRGGGEARTAALEVLVGRGHRALLADLLQPGNFTDETFAPLAANAVLTLGTGADLGRVLAFYRDLPPAHRMRLEAALRRLAAKHPVPDEAASLVIAAAEKLPASDAEPLYVVLAGVGGELALHSLSGLLKSASGEMRQAALRALGNWRNAQPAPALLALAREDADAEVRALAVRSATTLFTKSAFGGNNAPVPELVPAAIEGLRQVWAAAGQTAEQDAVVAALRTLKTPEAIAAAAELEKKMPRGKQP